MLKNILYKRRVKKFIVPDEYFKKDENIKNKFIYTPEIELNNNRN
jgi:hypothetical protein